MERFMKKEFWQRTGHVSCWVGLLAVTGLLAAGCAATKEEDVFFAPLPSDLTNITTTTATANAATSGSVATSGTGASGLAAIVQDADRFAIGDLVTVKFSGTIEQIPTHEERIKDDAAITLPLIGVVKAAGKTSGELQKEIHARYVPDYYRRLTVVVTGEQRVYSVGGQVRQPGRQSYIGATTVTKAIQSAGDFTDFAAKRRVELTRPDGKRFIIDCIKAAKDPSLDLPVYPGDKIHVDMRTWRDIFD